MKSADNLMARLGANMAESMGDIPKGQRAGGVPPQFAAPSGQYAGCTRIKDALAIETGRIVPDPDQPRREFDDEAIAELADSLKARGQLQPCRVRWSEAQGKWVIIAGERRWRAAVRAGLATLACVESRGEQTPEGILEDQLVENCVREDLRPLEQAEAYRRLMERRGWTYRQLGTFLHISKGKIAKAMALLELPAAVRDLVEQGSLTPHTAYELSRLDASADQVDLAGRVVAEGLTAAEAAAVVKDRKLGVRSPAAIGKATAPGPADDTAELAPPRDRTIKVEIRPGLVATVRGVASEAEAIEAFREAASLLRQRGRGRGRDHAT